MESKSISIAVVHELDQIIKLFDLPPLQASIRCQLIRFAGQKEWARVL